MIDPLSIAVAEESSRPSEIERLVEVIESHVRGEADSLAEYATFAAESDDPTTAMLMDLILDDERRHHDILRRMAARLRDDLNWTSSAGALPRPGRASRNTKLADLTRRFVEEEGTGARRLRDLSRETAYMYDGLLSLIFDVMADDSEKHRLILKFILRRVGGR